MNKSHGCSTAFFCVNWINQAYRKRLRRISNKWSSPHEPQKPPAFDLGTVHTTELSPNIHTQHWAKKKFPRMREEKQTGLASPQWNCHFCTGSLFHCQGPYPTQQNAAALSTATPWTAAGQLWFSHSSTPATLWHLFGFLLKAQTTCQLGTDHLCPIHIKESS